MNQHAPVPAPDPDIAASLADALIHTPKVDRILDTVRNHLGMEIAFVSRYLENGEREFTHITTDLPIPHRPGFREPQEESYCFHVLEGRLPELIPDAAELALARTLPITEALPVGCHLNVPLRLSDGSVYGSFCALSRDANDGIGPRDMEMMRAFASLAIGQIEDDLGDTVANERSRFAVERIIADRRLTIVHQPIHRLRNGRAEGVECLSRFPDAGARGPDRWFAEAERVGLGLELELHAVEAALATVSHVPQDKYLALNASPALVVSGRLPDLLPRGLRDRLVVEVTEHQQVDDYAGLAAALDTLRPHARIAIDDVGAGYSGLRHIVDLAPDILKLDMSLTRDVHRDPARRALTGAMVGFAAEIGASLVAEGIECAQEATTLHRLGVTHGQGWHYAKPMPVVRAQRHLLGLPTEDARPAPALQTVAATRVGFG